MVDAVQKTANSQNRINAGATTLFDNFETFLTLLTTQLKNQDPLSPLDSNEFTAQLTQMAGVEQQLLTNDLLQGMLAAQNGNALSNAAAYIGKEGTAIWNTTRYEDGSAEWSYELGKNAETVSLEVLDASGKVVWRGEGDGKTTGVHDFSWDGKTTGGGQVDDGGVYSLRVTAKDAAGKDVGSQTLIRGRVTSVEMYDGVPYVTIGKSIMPLETLISLEERMAATPPPTDAEEDDPSLIGTLARTLNPLSYLS
ncbi:flagellar hook capping FlgD N-terminal domain-containing protein [Brevundimonas sp.]|uniref:flagellar hook capping FlgD N-terminal domain-containing protein n=1 Tax=Brevundimonas sp. TaxID=1871086 RepID=UPI00289C0987|nr:flagellar hook capping FlgD N-terminal domain-containing protein [Brevundimonas sp.]